MLSAPGSIKVIAEVKRASPSKGALAAIADPAALAREYESGGASVISVLTEQRRFGGSLADLVAVVSSVDVPVLRKDFVVSSYQVWEARAHGADLAPAHRRRPRAAGPGLAARADPLARHDGAGRVPRRGRGAARAGRRRPDHRRQRPRPAHASRSTAATFARLAPLIPDNVVRIAESGVRGPHDVLEYAQAGATAVLVGESLVTGTDPRTAVANLVAAGAHPAIGSTRATGS